MRVCELTIFNDHAPAFLYPSHRLFDFIVCLLVLNVRNVVETFFKASMFAPFSMYNNAVIVRMGDVIPCAGDWDLIFFTLSFVFINYLFFAVCWFLVRDNAIPGFQTCVMYTALLFVRCVGIALSHSYLLFQSFASHVCCYGFSHEAITFSKGEESCLCCMCF